VNVDTAKIQGLRAATLKGDGAVDGFDLDEPAKQVVLGASVRSSALARWEPKALCRKFLTQKCVRIWWGRASATSSWRWRAAGQLGWIISCAIGPMPVIDDTESAQKSQ